MTPGVSPTNLRLPTGRTGGATPGVSPTTALQQLREPRLDPERKQLPIHRPSGIGGGVTQLRGVTPGVSPTKA